MPRFMLDTDAVGFALRGEGGVAAEILRRSPADLCISSITLAELRYGAELRRSRRLHGLIDTFATAVQVLPFDVDAAAHFGTVASGLKRAGTPIGGFDALIAAHALVVGATLVTNNARDFNRVRGLATENWV